MLVIMGIVCGPFLRWGNLCGEFCNLQWWNDGVYLQLNP